MPTNDISLGVGKTYSKYGKASNFEVGMDT